MNAFLWLFDTAGWIFGPAIMLAGLVALLLCLRASVWARARPASRTAFVASLVPFVAGICAAIFGFVIWQCATQPAANLSGPWLALGKVCLAGLIVTLVPLAWSLLLLRLQQEPA
jgi:hypothetical protein